jgi:hypothetical protein
MILIAVTTYKIPEYYANGVGIIIVVIYSALTIEKFWV